MTYPTNQQPAININNIQPGILNSFADFNIGIPPEPTEEEKALQKTNEELKAKVAALETELAGLKKILDE